MIKRIERAYHDGDGGFREQIFGLYPTALWEDDSGNEYIKMIRQHLLTCQPGAASLDTAEPGGDTSAAWAAMDNLIENESVRGFFHTHPAGFEDFSQQDWRTIYGLAVANGKRLLWHGVQSVGYAKSHFVCAQYIGGRVDIHDFGWFSYAIDDPILLLPTPLKIRLNGSLAVIDYST